ncbi:MAG: nucleotidyl transferase AbiEii/AbiGii toxin family protein [Ignavibacteriales bacterium]|nr:nucleotidyl transferase AbiEii/AbiGii toxin family protein [Ignavibacteriales bacterium]
MKKSPANTAASVLARLKNLAEKEHLDFNFLLLRYLQERFLARLARSKHADKFVLKGGFLLLAYNIQKARPTKDVDFLGINVPKDPKELEHIVQEIILADIDDGVQFQAESIRSEIIKEDADYEGIRIKIEARIGTTRNIIRLDFGFGDIVTPMPMRMDYPAILDRTPVKVFAYSKESIVAEKFEAMVKLGSFNSRMKDFYDIVFLSHEFDFEGPLLQSAIQKTFARRETSLVLSAKLLQSNLGEQVSLQNLWRAFLERSNLSTKDDFHEIFQSIRAFVKPIIDAATAGKPMALNWDRSAKEWRRRKES